LKSLRTIAGVAIWGTILVAGVVWGGRSSTGASWIQLAGRVGEYLITPPRELSASVPEEVSIEVRDPVFYQPRVPEEPKLVGEVRRVERINNERRVTISLDGRMIAGPSEKLAIALYQTDLSGMGAIRLLIPAAKQKELADDLAKAWNERKESTLAALAPALKQMMDDVYPVLEEEIEKSVVRHGEEFRNIMDRHHRDYWSSEFGQLAKDVAWPLVRTKAQPVVDSMAGEIWQRVSVWRLGWRYLADKIGVGGDSLEKEWNRFVAEDALPIIESRMTELADVASSVLSEASADPRVQEMLRISLDRLVQDPAMQSLMGQVARESLLDNEAVAEAMSRGFERPAVQSAIQDVLTQWEPVAVSVVQKIWSDPGGEISPDLARVLRSHVLGKDRRWLVLSAGEGRPGEKLMVVPAREPAGYPLPTRQGEMR
jgi:hypothetical protein